MAIQKPQWPHRTKVSTPITAPGAAERSDQMETRTREATTTKPDESAVSNASSLSVYSNQAGPGLLTRWLADRFLRRSGSRESIARVPASTILSVCVHRKAVSFKSASLDRCYVNEHHDNFARIKNLEIETCV